MVHCFCNRLHFTPYSWYSKDGKTKFITDKHGFTDMVSTTKIEELLNSYILEEYKPFKHDKFHTHWAYK